MTLADFVERWRLEPDGEAFRSQSSDLLPVRCDGSPAVLKVPFNAEERFGGILMRWWDGVGAARLHRLDEASGAMVLERACGTGDLRAMAESGGEDDAIGILCEATGVLHRPRAGHPPRGLVPLERWFEALPRAAAARGGVFASTWQVAEGLIASERQHVPLHGDIHHGNVLDFGSRGWLAIDPKHIFGERTFDYANMLRNPDPDTLPVAGRFHRQAAIIAHAAKLEPRRLMEWTYAFAGLSAAWIAEDGNDPVVDLAIAGLAGAALGR